MEREEIFNKVRDVLVEQLSVSEESVTMESAFLDDLGADSLDIVAFILELEEKFGIEIPDEEVENITIVEDIVDYIEENYEEN